MSELDRRSRATAFVEQVLKVLEGRWKLLILFHLFDGKLLRFSELERAIPAISKRRSMSASACSTCRVRRGRTTTRS